MNWVVNNSVTLNKIKEYKYQSLKELYSKLLPSQQIKFDKIYGSISNIKDDEYSHAVMLCENSINQE